MEPVFKDSLIIGRTSQGLEVRAMPLRLSRHLVVFELRGRGSVLRTSEVFDELQIFRQDRLVYSGRALVRGMMDTGAALICEASLSESWQDVDWDASGSRASGLRNDYLTFLDQWQKVYRVLPEFKLAVADMHTFLTDFKLWTEHVEVGMQSTAASDRAQEERDAAAAISEAAFPTLSALLERYEVAAANVEAESFAAHHAFVRRNLHPLLLTSPFMHRIYAKPLGYAGDYEMMNMIWRNDFEGDSLFAKLLHAFILQQAPARSVRHRVHHFTQKITEEVVRVSQSGRVAQIFGLGCGSAREVEIFLGHPLASHAEFRLLDFNEETLKYVESRVAEARRQYHVATPVKLIKRSVHYLLKESGEPGTEETGFDLIYTSGLYDYLTDRVCRMLNSLLYRQLRPGGVLIVSNFDPSNPIRNVMEVMFEWFLFHRNARQMAALAPEQAPPDQCVVHAETTGCNVFLEARRPA